MQNRVLAFVSITLAMLLTAVTIVHAQTSSQDLEIEDVFIQALTLRDFALDQALRDDSTCQLDMLCTSYQGILEGTFGPIDVDDDDDDDDRSILFIDFYGNYHCAGCSGGIPEPFVQIRFLLSKDGSPFEAIDEAIIGSALHNSGTDVIRRYRIPVETGTYTLQAEHRFSTTAETIPSRVALTQGMVRVEVLEEED